MSDEGRAPQQLTSWKEIAEHLRVAVRTAQAWEHGKGLPVHRMTGKKGRVVADPVELDHWRQSVFQRNHRFSNQRYYKISAALLSVLLIVAAAYESIHFLSKFRNYSPANSQTEQQPLVVVDHSKSGLSRKSIHKTDEIGAAPNANSALDRKVTFRDIDGDGQLETILDYNPINSSRSPSTPNRVAGNMHKDGNSALTRRPASKGSIPADPSTIQCAGSRATLRRTEACNSITGYQAPQQTEQP